MIRTLFVLIFLSFQSIIFAQFPPAADQLGTTAIHKDSSIFINWAKTAEVIRGEQNISDDSLNFAEVGFAIFATNSPDNQIVSLGDGGSIILIFDPPISNGMGFDFAVFENGFPTLGGYFLELAFVEVSSDGQFFARFPATSLTDTSMQLGTFDLINPIKINNLAGKYVGGFGTPFDLEELAKIPEVDISKITHVKIIDVIGSLVDSLASFDAFGNKINEPFPTPFPSGGFDLDAVGVIHQNTSTSFSDFSLASEIKIYPNPLTTNDLLEIEIAVPIPNSIYVQLFTANGVLLKSVIFKSRNIKIPFLGFPQGVYWLKIGNNDGWYVRKIVLID